MKSFVERLKEIPIWVIAIVLVSGTVAAAGIWLTQVETPVTYGEPFIVEYSDEKTDSWERLESLPPENTVIKNEIDLTYRTFHDFFRVTYEGRRSVKLNVTFFANRDNQLEREHVGFVVLEGIIHPEEIGWNESSAVYQNQTIDINWGLYDEGITLEAHETQNYTVINVLSNNAPVMNTENDLSINWQFRRAEVGPRPVDLEDPHPFPGVYNLTPFILLVSVALTGVVSYVLFKDLKGVR